MTYLIASSQPPAQSPLLRIQLDPTILQCLTTFCSYEDLERTSPGLAPTFDVVVLHTPTLVFSVKSTSTNSSREVSTFSSLIVLRLLIASDAISMFSTIGTRVNSRTPASPYELVRLRMERPAACPRAGGA